MVRHAPLVLMGTLVMGVSATPMNLFDDGRADNSTCPGPFVPVHGYCVFLDHTVKGTWQEMREYCQSLDSDLAILSSVKFYFESLQYLKLTTTKAAFWIGASDLDTEGQWLWIDGTPVVMGAPYWANYGCNNQIQPAGGTNQNCAILENYLSYYLNDVNCSYKANPFCVM
ncbi:hepatic lectin-like [Eriocheir sinensis]|uniref:hepatic lectin-like n=1 Tax=Eriocheir sinensis TaxID=95602 RepID=UPI0021C7F604|nr:hepatic lectin-like [Eriocheir sinensis]